MEFKNSGDILKQVQPILRDAKKLDGKEGSECQNQVYWALKQSSSQVVKKLEWSTGEFVLECIAGISIVGGFVPMFLSSYFLPYMMIAAVAGVVTLSATCVGIFIAAAVALFTIVISKTASSMLSQRR